MAGIYDVTFTGARVGRALRGIVRLRLKQTFRPSQRVLELGRGSGADAARPAGSGAIVAATAACAGTIQIASSTARAGNWEERLAQGSSPLAAGSDHFIVEAILLH
jgi:methylase of polypeptide subunit release factors